MPIVTSFRRKDLLSGEVLWSAFEKLQINTLVSIVVTVFCQDACRFGRGIKTMGRPRSVMEHIKKVLWKLRPKAIV